MEVIQTNILSDKHHQEKKRGKTALLMLKYLRISKTVPPSSQYYISKLLREFPYQKM